MPAAGATTFTSTVQTPLAGMLPPLKVTTAAPAVGANVAAPQPEVLAAGVAATTIAPGEVGRVSLKATPVNAVAVLGLLRVKRKVAATLAAIGLVKKRLLMLTGAVATTVSVAVLATPVPPLLVLTDPVLLL